MAVLTTEERAQVRADVIARWNSDSAAPPIDKPQLAAVIGAMDDWIEANFTSLNAAIPQPQRGLLSARLKFMIFMTVAMRRFGIL